MKNSTSKKFVSFIFVSLLFLGSIYAQQRVEFNRFSLEASGGIHIPLSPKEGIEISDYIGFQQFQIGARYMLSEKFGVRGLFAYNKFVNSSNKDEHNSFTRGALEGVANLGDLFMMDPRFLEQNGLHAHAGVGLTFSSPSQTRGTDRQGIILVGLTGLRKLSSSMALTGDVSYIGNFRQHSSYNGSKLPDGKAVMGGFMNISIGLTFYLGSLNEHADWYW